MAMNSHLKHLASIKVAIQICHHPDVKKHIFFASWLVFKEGEGKIFAVWNPKDVWNERVQEAASAVMINSNFPRLFQEQILNFLMPVAIRMIIWVKYQKNTFDLSSTYLMNFSRSSLYLSNGLIDDVKAAGLLVKDETLSIEKRFKIACHNCCIDDIVSLYYQIPKDERKHISKTRKTVNQSALVKFWSYIIEGEIDTLKGDQDVNSYGLNISVECGSKTAVEYFWKQLSDREQKDFAIPIALKVLKYINDSKFCIPQNFCRSILFFLFSEMEEDQQVKFLRKVVEITNGTNILYYCLKWPYQDYFMKMVNMMWDVLPEVDYCDLLLLIAEMIEIDRNDIIVKRGEERCYDYRTLLNEFWCQSPGHFKRFVLTYLVNYEGNQYVISNYGTELLHKLLLLNNLTCLDKENIDLILSAVTVEEKLDIVHSAKGHDICLILASSEKWEILDDFLRKCFPSEDIIKKFKKTLCFSVDGMYIYRRFVQTGKYDSAEEFLKWSVLPAKEIILLKQKSLFSEPMEKYLISLLLEGQKTEVVENIMRCHLSSEIDITVFKKRLIFSKTGIYGCAKLITYNTVKCMGYIEEFIEWSKLTSEDEIIDFKRKLALIRGSWICKILICENNWKQLQIFLTWCFGSEEEILEFKETVLNKKSRQSIHFNLIKDNKWQVAETFFDWLRLSELEIKALKKKTLFEYKPARKMFNDLMFRTEGSEIFCKHCDKMKAVEHLLRWYLTNKDELLEFQEEFQKSHQNVVGSESVIKRFNLIVEKRLKEMEEDEKMLNKDGKRKPDNYNLTIKLKIPKREH